MLFLIIIIIMCTPRKHVNYDYTVCKNAMKHTKLQQITFLIASKYLYNQFLSQLAIIKNKEFNV